MMIKEAKSLARKILVGRYGTVIGAHMLYGLIMLILVLLAIFGIGMSLYFLPADLNVNFFPQAAVRSIGLMVVGIIVFSVAIILITFIGTWFEMGEKKLMLNICRGHKYAVSDLFYAFKSGSHPWRYLGATIIKSILVSSVAFVPRFFDSINMITRIIQGGSIRNISTLTMTTGMGDSIGLLINIILGVLFVFVELQLIDKKSETILDAFKDSIALTKGHKLEIFWLTTFSFLFWEILGAICPIASLWIAPYISATMTIFYLMCRDEAGYAMGEQDYRADADSAYTYDTHSYAGGNTNGDTFESASAAGGTSYTAPNAGMNNWSATAPDSSVSGESNNTASSQNDDNCTCGRQSSDSGNNKKDAEDMGDLFENIVNNSK